MFMQRPNLDTASIGRKRRNRRRFAQLCIGGGRRTGFSGSLRRIAAGQSCDSVHKFAQKVQGRVQEGEPTIVLDCDQHQY